MLGANGLKLFRLVLADLNHDERADIVAYSTLGGSPGLFVAINDGSGGFGGATPVALTHGRGLSAIAAGDVDGDGHLDVAALLTTSSHDPSASGFTEIDVALGDGAGAFTAAATTRYGRTDLTARHMELADMNGDGNLDVVVAGSQLSAVTGYVATVALFAGDGAGHFASPIVVDASPGEGSGLCDATVGDFDGDGALDVLAASHQGDDGSGGALKLVRLQGDSFAVTDVPTDGTTCPNAVGLTAITSADIDLDGKLDVVYTTAPTASTGERPTVKVGFGDGTGGFVDTHGLSGDHMAHLAGDFDGAGQPDLLVRGAPTCGAPSCEESTVVFMNRMDGRREH